jgi:hypothetical protein
MPGPNIIRYTKTFAFPANSKVPTKTKAELIQELLAIPAVTVRGHRDDIIEFDGNKDEPRLRWKAQVIEIMDEYSIRELLKFAEKRHESETRKF